MARDAITSTRDACAPKTMSRAIKTVIDKNQPVPYSPNSYITEQSIA